MKDTKTGQYIQQVTDMDILKAIEPYTDIKNSIDRTNLASELNMSKRRLVDRLQPLIAGGHVQCFHAGKYLYWIDDYLETVKKIVDEE